MENFTVWCIEYLFRYTASLLSDRAEFVTIWRRVIHVTAPFIYITLNPKQICQETVCF